MDADIPKSQNNGVNLGGKNVPTIGSGTTQPNLQPNAPSATLNANTGDLNSSQGVNINQSNVSKEVLNQNAEIEIQKERIKAEFNLREQKLNELRELLKAGVINFDEYMRGIKEI
jgi:hypothetical protein